MRYFITTFLATLIGFTGLHAQHTFSIVAVDPVTGEVGGAGATCLNNSGCGGCGGAIIISGIVPGRGAINAQATVCIPNSNLNNGVSRMQMGDSPQQVLDFLLANDACIFGDTSRRQYGIADLDSSMSPRAVGFSGSQTTSWSNHLTGSNYAIQGNILLGQQILDSMEAGFLNTPGPLCEKLMAALQGANVPGADTRCLNDSVSSKSAFIRIARPGDTIGNFWMDLNVPEVAQGVEPIDSLHVLFDEFKLANGLASAHGTPAIRVFPNPAGDLLNVDLRRAGLAAPVIGLYDVMGKKLAEFHPGPDADLRIGLRPYGPARFLVLRIRDTETGFSASRKVLLR